jgi:hypothetical protein
VLGDVYGENLQVQCRFSKGMSFSQKSCPRLVLSDISFEKPSRGLRLGLQKAAQRRATFVTQRDEWAKRECAISADLRGRRLLAITGSGEQMRSFWCIVNTLS